MKAKVIKPVSLFSFIGLMSSTIFLLLDTFQIVTLANSIQSVLLGLILLLLVIQAIAVIIPLFYQVDDLTEQVKQANTHDALTALNQRHTFTPLVNQALALSLRYKWSLSVIRFDIDHFKSINSEYGNKTGDEVIKHVATTIKENCRESDNIFRFDGEEFVVLLPQTNQDQALTLAKKINQKVLSAPLTTEKLILEVSISGGVSAWKSHEPDIELTLNRADLALQQAKDDGRNKVILDN